PSTLERCQSLELGCPLVQVIDRRVNVIREPTKCILDDVVSFAINSFLRQQTLGGFDKRGNLGQLACRKSCSPLRVRAAIYAEITLMRALAHGVSDDTSGVGAVRGPRCRVHGYHARLSLRIPLRRYAPQPPEGVASRGPEPPSRGPGLFERSASLRP